jgi:hypothetical protein
LPRASRPEPGWGGSARWGASSDEPLGVPPGSGPAAFWGGESTLRPPPSVVVFGQYYHLRNLVQRWPNGKLADALCAPLFPFRHSHCAAENRRKILQSKSDTGDLGKIGARPGRQPRPGSGTHCHDIYLINADTSQGNHVRTNHRCTCTKFAQNHAKLMVLHVQYSLHHPKR